MEPTIVNRTIVLCKVTGNAGGTDQVVKLAGGVGLVLQLTMPVDQAETFEIPATIISNEAGAIIKEYIESLGPEGKPVARIEKSYDFTGNAVYVPSFSARGPNPLYTEILKPDLVAPGMNILAAYPDYLPFGDDPSDTRRFPFQTMSGTSMATPHVTGAAAYLKSFHPTWSPASLRSALMTTARPVPPSR
ncbi:subtilisin-like protease SBT4.15, partial [Phalaenopsis equestris]|uniref:subtilisin-like protease SBT4.15 n=1 Tax=Phalaenopsis equestris TaxID=78828 RepID=UPI0009E53810